MAQARISPASVLWDAEEVERVDRATLALILHKLPEEVDGMSLQDQWDVLQVNRDQMAAAKQQQVGRRK